ncbi:MAG: aminoacyltransferase, partial [Chloroflexi bacterium]|nr:aminoacyltransferase [Chloroflexota bacterium]
MTYQTISPSPDAWDAFVETHPRAHLLQTSGWGVLKTTFGWQAERIALARDDGSLAAGVQVLYRPLPLHLGRLAYAPFGPLVDWTDDAQVSALRDAIDRAVKRRRTALLKIEPGYGLESVDFTRWGFRLSPQTVQPPRSYLVDLTADEDAILARMNQGTRRNIRKSERFEVAIREGTRDDLDSFNALMQETGARDAFGVHAPRYYEHVYERFVPQGRGVL